MKKFFSLIILAAMTVAMPVASSASQASQSRKQSFSKSAPLTPGQQKIKNDIEFAQMMIPMQISDELSFTSMEYDSKIPAVVMEYYFVGGLDVYNSMKKNFSDPTTRMDILNNLMMNPVVGSMSENMANEGVALSMRYVFPNVDKTLTITFTPAEIKKGLENSLILDPKEEALKAVKREIEAVSTPMDAGNGMSITKINIQDGNVVYHIECAETGYDVASLGPVILTQKDAMWNNLMQNALTEAFMKNIRTAGLGLQYRYIGKRTGVSYPVTFTNDEMKRRLGL